MYYVLDKVPVVSVAVSDTPAGRYQFYGYVQYADGTRLGEKLCPASLMARAAGSRIMNFLRLLLLENMAIRIGYEYRGVIVSNNDLHIDSYKPADKPMYYGGNNHGSIEPIAILEDGSIPQAEMTSCGPNGGPLAAPAWLHLH